MTEDRYRSLIGGDDDEAQFWVEFGIFCIHAQYLRDCENGLNPPIWAQKRWITLPSGRKYTLDRMAVYIGHWIVEGASNVKGRELGRCLDGDSRLAGFDFHLQAKILARHYVPQIVIAMKGQDEDGFRRQFRLRNGYQR